MKKLYIILIALVGLGVIAFAGYKLMGTKQQGDSSQINSLGSYSSVEECVADKSRPGQDSSKANDECITFLSQSQTATSPKVKSVSGITTPIKHLGVNLESYNPSTNKAGDFMFTKAKLHDGMLFMNYGYTIKDTVTGQPKSNPQPTFILPLGTKVRSTVDGTVIDVPKIYSNDFSVQVQAEGSDLVFEMEHVSNVSIKKGDKVKAGDVVAEVSTHDSQYNDGMGLVEIGVLKPGSPPSHVCPFEYVDSNVKDDMLAKITAFQKAWEEYRGDTTIYDESKVVIPGCESLTPIEG